MTGVDPTHTVGRSPPGDSTAMEDRSMEDSSGEDCYYYSDGERSPQDYESGIGGWREAGGFESCLELMTV